MSVQRFLNIIAYTNECPDDIHIGRWNAMKIWFRTRVSRNESIICD